MAAGRANSTQQLQLDPERVAYWYFRLNGFLTTLNFVVHPENGAEQRTDVDLLGVRFPHRAELLTNAMPDDPLFAGLTKPCLVIAEVKKGRCKLNGPWTRREDRNLHRILAAIGAIPATDWERAAQDLYDAGVYEDEQLYLTLCCLGETQNPEYTRRFARVPQILWTDVAKFVYGRFIAYLEQKLAHRQWDETGRLLYSLVRDSNSEHEFTEKLLKLIAAHGQ